MDYWYDGQPDTPEALLALLDSDPAAVSPAMITMMMTEYAQLKAAVHAALPRLEQAAYGNRYARKAVNDLYRGLGERPPHQVQRDQREHPRRQRQQQRLRA